MCCTMQRAIASVIRMHHASLYMRRMGRGRMLAVRSVRRYCRNLPDVELRKLERRFLRPACKLQAAGRQSLIVCRVPTLSFLHMQRVAHSQGLLYLSGPRQLVSASCYDHHRDSACSSSEDILLSWPSQQSAGPLGHPLVHDARDIRAALHDPF